MRNNYVPRFILVIIFSFILSQNLQANSQWHSAKEGNKIILIRHALAPGGGDPYGFKIDDCKTQRNLNQTGIDQSKKIGNLFKLENIPIDQILSSQWCRCKDTAKYAFGTYKEFSALNSTFREPNNPKAKKQIKKLKNFIINWDGNGGNLVLVTHFKIINPSFPGVKADSGEMIVVNNNMKVLGRIRFPYDITIKD